MLRQEFFGKKHDPAPVTPIKPFVEQVIAEMTNTPPQTSAVLLPFNRIPISTASMVPLKKKIVLNTGDNLAEMTDAQKSACHAATESYSFRRNFHTPKFAFRTCFLGKMDELAFEDFYITQGMEESWKTCAYGRDKLGAWVCFNIKAFKIGDFLYHLGKNEEQTFSILDPYSITTVNSTILTKFKDHPQYEYFMKVKGNEAC